MKCATCSRRRSKDGTLRWRDRACPSPLAHPDELVRPVGIALELLARAVEHDAAAVHHGGARRDVERQPRVLLDHDHGEPPGGGEPFDRARQLLDEDRGEALVIATPMTRPMANVGSV